jgi:hypothetical protein
MFATCPAYHSAILRVVHWHHTRRKKSHNRLLAPTPWLKASSAAPEETDDGSGGYDQSFKHLGGHWAAINA